MKTYTFEGYSDDVFGYECSDGSMNEQGCYNNPAVYRLTSQEGTMDVVGLYGKGPMGGVWCVGVAPVDEDVPIPTWELKCSLNEKGYSARLEIEVPDDTTVEEVRE